MRGITGQIFDLFARGGADAYFGEAVTQQEHALQTACLAERAGSTEALVIAALLHDIGHLLHGLPESIADEGIDGRHEEAGHRWLAGHFEAEVTEPVRLHVSAKRYLCAVEPPYMAALSPASTESLRLQGGLFTAEEVREFEQNAFFRDAVALRRWDDEAKVPSLEVPGLEHYRARVARLCRF